MLGTTSSAVHEAHCVPPPPFAPFLMGYKRGAGLSTQTTPPPSLLEGPGGQQPQHHPQRQVV